MRRLRNRYESIISHGYGELAATLVDAGLVDEIHAGIHPFLVGEAEIRLTEPLAGRRKFRGQLVGLDPEGEPAALIEDEAGGRHRLPLAKIAKAHVELEP